MVLMMASSTPKDRISNIDVFGREVLSPLYRARNEIQQEDPETLSAADTSKPKLTSAQEIKVEVKRARDFAKDYPGYSEPVYEALKHAGYYDPGLGISIYGEPGPHSTKGMLKEIKQLAARHKIPPPPPPQKGAPATKRLGQTEQRFIADMQALALLLEPYQYVDFLESSDRETIKQYRKICETVDPSEPFDQYATLVQQAALLQSKIRALDLPKSVKEYAKEPALHLRRLPSLLESVAKEETGAPSASTQQQRADLLIPKAKAIHLETRTMVHFDKWPKEPTSLHQLDKQSAVLRSLLFLNINSPEEARQRNGKPKDEVEHLNEYLKTVLVEGFPTLFGLNEDGALEVLAPDTDGENIIQALGLDERLPNDLNPQYFDAKVLKELMENDENTYRAPLWAVLLSMKPIDNNFSIADKVESYEAVTNLIEDKQIGSASKTNVGLNVANAAMRVVETNRHKMTDGDPDTIKASFGSMFSKVEKWEQKKIKAKYGTWAAMTGRNPAEKIKPSKRCKKLMEGSFEKYAKKETGRKLPKPVRGRNYTVQPPEPIQSGASTPVSAAPKHTSPPSPKGVTDPLSDTGSNDGDGSVHAAAPASASTVTPTPPHRPPPPPPPPAAASDGTVPPPPPPAAAPATSLADLAGRSLTGARPVSTSPSDDETSSQAASNTSRFSKASTASSTSSADVAAVPAPPPPPPPPKVQVPAAPAAAPAAAPESSEGTSFGQKFSDMLSTISGWFTWNKKQAKTPEPSSPEPAPTTEPQKSPQSDFKAALSAVTHALQSGASPSAAAQAGNAASADAAVRAATERAEDEKRSKLPALKEEVRTEIKASSSAADNAGAASKLLSGFENATKESAFQSQDEFMDFMTSLCDELDNVQKRAMYIALQNEVGNFLNNPDSDTSDKKQADMLGRKIQGQLELVTPQKPPTWLESFQNFVNRVLGRDTAAPEAAPPPPPPRVPESAPLADSLAEDSVISAYLTGFFEEHFNEAKLASLKDILGDAPYHPENFTEAQVQALEALAKTYEEEGWNASPILALMVLGAGNLPPAQQVDIHLKLLGSLGNEDNQEHDARTLNAMALGIIDNTKALIDSLPEGDQADLLETVQDLHYAAVFSTFEDMLKQAKENIVFDADGTEAFVSQILEGLQEEFGEDLTPELLDTFMRGLCKDERLFTREESQALMAEIRKQSPALMPDASRNAPPPPPPPSRAATEPPKAAAASDNAVPPPPPPAPTVKVLNEYIEGSVLNDHMANILSVADEDDDVLDAFNAALVDLKKQNLFTPDNIRNFLLGLAGEATSSEEPFDDDEEVGSNLHADEVIEMYNLSIAFIRANQDLEQGIIATLEQDRAQLINQESQEELEAFLLDIEGASHADLVEQFDFIINECKNSGSPQSFELCTKIIELLTNKAQWPELSDKARIDLVKRIHDAADTWKADAQAEDPDNSPQAIARMEATYQNFKSTFTLSEGAAKPVPPPPPPPPKKTTAAKEESTQPEGAAVVAANLAASQERIEQLATEEANKIDDALGIFSQAIQAIPQEEKETYQEPTDEMLASLTQMAHQETHKSAVAADQMDPLQQLRDYQSLFQILATTDLPLEEKDAVAKTVLSKSEALRNDEAPPQQRMAINDALGAIRKAQARLRPVEKLDVHEANIAQLNEVVNQLIEASSTPPGEAQKQKILEALGQARVFLEEPTPYSEILFEMLTSMAPIIKNPEYMKDLDYAEKANTSLSVRSEVTQTGQKALAYKDARLTYPVFTRWAQNQRRRIAALPETTKIEKQEKKYSERVLGAIMDLCVNEHTVFCKLSQLEVTLNFVLTSPGLTEKDKAFITKYQKKIHECLEAYKQTGISELLTETQELSLDEFIEKIHDIYTSDTFSRYQEYLQSLATDHPIINAMAAKYRASTGSHRFLTTTFDDFAMKPVQRIPQYTMTSKEMVEKYEEKPSSPEAIKQKLRYVENRLKVANLAPEASQAASDLLLNAQKEEIQRPTSFGLANLLLPEKIFFDTNALKGLKLYLFEEYPSIFTMKDGSIQFTQKPAELGAGDTDEALQFKQKLGIQSSSSSFDIKTIPLHKINELIKSDPSPIWRVLKCMKPTVPGQYSLAEKNHAYQELLSLYSQNELQHEPTVGMHGYMQTLLTKFYPEKFSSEAGLFTIEDESIKSALGFDDALTNRRLNPSNFNTNNLTALYNQSKNPVWVVLKSMKPIDAGFPLTDKIGTYQELVALILDGKLGEENKYALAKDVLDAAESLATEKSTSSNEAAVRASLSTMQSALQEAFNNLKTVRPLDSAKDKVRAYLDKVALCTKGGFGEKNRDKLTLNALSSATRVFRLQVDTSKLKLKPHVKDMVLLACERLQQSDLTEDNRAKLRASVENLGGKLTSLMKKNEADKLEASVIERAIEDAIKAEPTAATATPASSQPTTWAASVAAAPAVAPPPPSSPKPPVSAPSTVSTLPKYEDLPEDVKAAVSEAEFDTIVNPVPPGSSDPWSGGPTGNEKILAYRRKVIEIGNNNELKPEIKIALMKNILQAAEAIKAETIKSDAINSPQVMSNDDAKTYLIEPIKEAIAQIEAEVLVKETAEQRADSPESISATTHEASSGASSRTSTPVSAIAEGVSSEPLSKKELVSRMHSAANAKVLNVLAADGFSVEDQMKKAHTADQEAVAPLVEKMANIDMLVAQQASLESDAAQENEPIVQGLAPNENAEITENYPGFRGIKGDGDCYYRAVMYATIEQIIISPNRAELFEALRKNIAAYEVARMDINEIPSEALDTLMRKLHEAEHGNTWTSLAAFEAEMKAKTSGTDALLVESARILTATKVACTPLADMAEIKTEEERTQLIETTLKDKAWVQNTTANMNALPEALGIVHGNLVTASQGGVSSVPLSSNNESSIEINIFLTGQHYSVIYSEEQYNKLQQYEANAALAAADNPVDSSDAFMAALNDIQEIKSRLIDESEQERTPQETLQAYAEVIDRIAAKEEARLIDENITAELIEELCKEEQFIQAKSTAPESDVMKHIHEVVEGLPNNEENTTEQFREFKARFHAEHGNAPAAPEKSAAPSARDSLLAGINTAAGKLKKVEPSSDDQSPKEERPTSSSDSLLGAIDPDKNPKVNRMLQEAQKREAEKSDDEEDAEAWDPDYKP